MKREVEGEGVERELDQRVAPRPFRVYDAILVFCR